MSIAEFIDENWGALALPALQIRDNGDDKRVVSEARRLYSDIPGGIEGAECLDVGAHIGLVARLFVEQGASHVTSVEPDPDSFTYLVANTKGLPVTPINAAVTSRSGSVPYYRLEGSPSCNRTTRPRRGGEEIEVESFSLADLLDDTAASVLKMDIEEGEYDLLDTLTDLPDRIRVLVMEVHFGGMGQKRRADGLALIDSFAWQGFDLVKGSKMTPKCFNFNGVWRR